MCGQNRPGCEPAESDPSLAWDSCPVTFRDRSSQSLCDPYPPSGTSWRATKMVVQGARERMFCHIAPIRMPCSRSLACCPVDLICRNEGVNYSDTYALPGMFIRS